MGDDRGWGQDEYIQNLFEEFTHIDQYGNQFDKDEITFRNKTCEMLRITPDGFYVRGVKVPEDQDEAQAVYNAFKNWLVWNTLESKNK